MAAAMPRPEFSHWKRVDAKDPVVAMCNAYWGNEIEETDLESNHNPDDMEIDDDATPLHPKAINLETDFDPLKETATSAQTRVLVREEYRKALTYIKQLLDQDTTGTKRNKGILVTGQPGIGKLVQYYGYNHSSQ